MHAHRIAILALPILALSAAVSADATEVMFENDPAGPAANGFSSADSPLLTFSNSDGGPMEIGDFGVESIGQALAVGADDSSFLVMNFALAVDFLSMDFGNDDPLLSDPGDSVVLTAFLGGIEVGQTEVVMNRDDVMNQTIFFGGVLFDSATVEFYVSSDGLTEVVDNIKFNTIPAPPAGAIALLALAALPARRRRG
jgi:hypothetical protein